ncbi:MAG: 50S ribosomal protein L29 [Chitinophagaceae bacterium]
MPNKTADFNRSLKDLNENDLNARLNEDKIRLKRLEFAHAISPLENPMSIRNLRKDIARLKTELKKRKFANLMDNLADKNQETQSAN